MRRPLAKLAQRTESQRAVADAHLHRINAGERFHGTQDLRQRLLQPAFGVADIERCYARPAVGDQAIQPPGAPNQILELGIDQVLDRFTEDFGL
jgi:hypothetical protein